MQIGLKIRHIVGCFIPTSYKLFLIRLFNRLKARYALKHNSDVKLEIGSGPHKRQGWLTLDISWDSDFYWDLMKQLPFPDESLRMIYSSHTLEHFTYKQLVRILKDCHRVLKNGGIFSAAVPNARTYLLGYVNPKDFPRSFLQYRAAVISETPIDFVNYIAYMDGHHRHMFDEENLVRLVREAGFSNVRLRKFDPGLDLLGRDYETIYVEAVK